MTPSKNQVTVTRRSPGKRVACAADPPRDSRHNTWGPDPSVALAAIPSKARRQDRFEVRFGPGAGQIEIGFAQGVDQRADHVRPADGNAARRADVSAQAIEKDDLAVEQ